MIERNLPNYALQGREKGVDYLKDKLIILGEFLCKPSFKPISWIYHYHLRGAMSILYGTTCFYSIAQTNYVNSSILIVSSISTIAIRICVSFFNVHHLKMMISIHPFYWRSLNSVHL